MALNLPKMPDIGAADGKSRVFFVLAGVLGVAILGYAIIKFTGEDSTSTGPSKVANPAANLASVPGSQLSPQYAQALRQSNAQASQQAQMSGGSAVPTMMNVGGPQGFAAGNCTTICPSDDNVDVTNTLNDLVKQGKLTQEDADKLSALAKSNVTPDQYAAALEEMVRQGKLTPDQARKLLDDYKKQHGNAQVMESAQFMDGLIKSGKLPVDVANHLLDLQKRHLSPAEYQAELERLVKEGKISPEVAAQLLAQYTQQQQKELAKDGAFQLQQMANQGAITPAVAKDLAALQAKNVPVDEYAAELDRLVKEGKLTPEAAAKLLEQYKQQRLGLAASSATMAALLSKGGPKAEEAKRLLALQGNNASLQQYGDELKRAVQAGILTPEEAAKLLAEYRTAVVAVGNVAPGTITALPGADDFAKLQQQVQAQQTVQPAIQATTAQFDAAQEQAEAQAAKDRMQRIQDLEGQMTGQAQQLISSWQNPPMVHMAGTIDIEKKDTKTGTKGGAASAAGGTGANGAVASTAMPLVKAGSILFAVLDTNVDSDYPDTPVMATIVQGQFKGAKLLGKVQFSQGQNQDRASLTFTTMSVDSWPTNKTINAFAIDPDTARTVMASEVDRHYLSRYGALIAASFLSGYSGAIMNSGATTTSGIFGTSTTRSAFSPADKLTAGLGQIGTNLTSIAQTYTTTPITVRINAGVGLGILFMADMTQ